MCDLLGVEQLEDPDGELNDAEDNRYIWDRWRL